MIKTLLSIALLLTAAVGCGTTNIQQIATPARIEAVTALGAYYGGKAAIKNGNRPGLERAVSGLKALEASGKADIPAIVSAVDAAGITFFASPEGQLTLGAVITFSDFWSTNAQPILDDARARAVLKGSVRGFELALTNATTRALAPVDPVAEALTAEAVATR